MTLKKDLEQEPLFDFSKLDETDMKVFEIMSRLGTQTKKINPIQFSIVFGRECWKEGREEMKKEVTEKLNK